MKIESAMECLECGMCGRRRDAHALAGLCECGRPLLARYRVDPRMGPAWRTSWTERLPGVWRFGEMLPPVDRPLALGEGDTPLLPASPALLRRAPVCELWFKWEGTNPTGSFKARGMALAISRALCLGARRFVVPTAGNAGAAAALYARAADAELDVFMPADSDEAFFDAVTSCGARLHRIDGLISDCGRHARQAVAAGAFDLSTLREPYRLEGKKTMGYELWEQLGGRLPDWIVYPTGGGTGLIGVWKAFAELEALGLVGSERPRMAAVQMEGCAPMVSAFAAGLDTAPSWPDAHTDVLGLRVPGAVGDSLILRALRESGGAAVAVPEDAAFASVDVLRAELNVESAPEGGAALAGLQMLAERGLLGPNHRVVVFLTGSAGLYRNILRRHGLSWA